MPANSLQLKAALLLAVLLLTVVRLRVALQLADHHHLRTVVLQVVHQVVAIRSKDKPKVSLKGKLPVAKKPVDM